MTLKLLGGDWEVEVLLKRTNPAYNDNVILQITEHSHPEFKVIRGDAISIGITATDARELARRLAEVAAKDEAAAREEVRAWGAPAEPAPPRKPRAKSSALFTPTQGRYLAFIHRYQQKNYGRSPAEADIQRHMLVSGPSVHQMIVSLERKGLIVRTPGQARSIQLLVPPESLPEW